MRRFFIFPVIMLAAALLLGAVVMLLWNALLPMLFHLPPLGYGQAIGLLVLCRILFGGFHGHRPHHRPPFSRHHWLHLSDEERAKLRQEWHSRCGCGRSTSEAPAGGGQ